MFLHTMSRNLLVAMALLVPVLPATPAASHALDDQVQRFVTIHGTQTLVGIRDHGRGAGFAGRFASDPIPGPPDIAARTFLEQWREMWGFDPVTDLVFSHVHHVASLVFVRFQHRIDAVDVEGSNVVVTLDPVGRVRQVASAFAWIEDRPPGVPSLTATRALESLRNAYPELEPTGQRRLVYLDLGKGRAALAWALRTHSRTGPEAPEAYVDAHDGRILAVLDTNAYADGNVYETNPAADPTVVRRELLNLASTTNLDGTYAIAYSCAAPAGRLCPERIRHASPDTDGNYLFSPDEPSTTDPFAEVMGYYHLDRINRHMEDAYGHAFTCDGHRWMEVQVNMDHENAWYGDWNDDGCGDINMGQSEYDFTYDSAILYHEFGHGINHVYSPLSRDFDELGADFSGPGLNEGFADYWAATLLGRPVIGEYASLGEPGEVGFRDLSGRAVCPDDLWGESHYDSPVWSTTLWDIREAIGMDKTDRLALAILASLSNRPDYDEAGLAAMSQASALESTGVLSSSDVSVVDAAVADHALVGCRRIVALEHGYEHVFIFPAWRNGHDAAPALQFSLHAPATATRVTAIIDQYTTEGAYVVFVKRDSHVVFSREGPDITVEDYDFRFNDSPDRVSFTEWSDPVLEPSTTYHYAIVHNASIMMLGVEALIVATEPTDAATDVALDPDVEDMASDVPDEDGPTGDAQDDVPSDPDPEPGSFTSRGGGCACALVR